MKTPAERKAEAIASADQIMASAKAEERDLSPEEVTSVEALMDDADKATEEIGQAEAARRAAGRVEAARASAAQSTRRAGPTTSTHGTPGIQVGTLAVKDNFEDDPRAGFKTPRAFMQKVMEVGRGNTQAATDPRMQFLAAAGSDEQGEYADQYGGFLVPEAYQPGVLSIAPDLDPVAGMVRRVPMAAPTVKINARVDKDHSSSVSGGLRVYRRAEADTVTASRTQYEQVTLTATALMGIAYATDEIMMDSPESFSALIATGFGDEFAAVKMEERLNGVGGGEFEGVNNAACLISVAKETGQAASTLTYNNILAILARAWRPQMWLASRTCIPELARMSVSVGTGGSAVWMPSAQPGVPSTLLGLPLYFSERMAAVGTAGDIMACNWGEYLEGDLGGTNAAESIHVRFVNAESAFRFYQRNAGAPWWRTALTPKAGDTLSPFVRVAVRS